MHHNQFLVTALAFAAAIAAQNNGGNNNGGGGGGGTTLNANAIQANSNSDGQGANDPGVKAGQAKSLT